MIIVPVNIIKKLKYKDFEHFEHVTFSFKNNKQINNLFSPKQVRNKRQENE